MLDFEELSSSLLAISPVDGRYRKSVKELSDYFSEFALMKYRVLIEIEYFIALVKLPLPELNNFPQKQFSVLQDIYKNFTIDDAKKIKEIETATNHDMKAVEYYIKDQFIKLGLDQYKEFIHFGLTSNDINNTAIPYSFKLAIEQVLYPEFFNTLKVLKDLANKWQGIPILARTHGQPATPTRIGKEINVFIERIENQLKLFKTISYSAKFGGAVGNFNAHHVAYPEIDWPIFANNFIKSFGLERLEKTTQIENYDNFSAMCDNLSRINNILINLCRDIWIYIMLGYFKQKIKEGEVGSSTMPHKVNPIDFESAEGNAGVANAMFLHFKSKLPISRLQRDLTDSTVIRNIGIPIAHTIIVLKCLVKGLNKLELNREVIDKDLDDNWVIVAEAIQTILRKEGYPNPYETLKELTRVAKVGKEAIHSFIDDLAIKDDLKVKLKSITPYNYVGI